MPAFFVFLRSPGKCRLPDTPEGRGLFWHLPPLAKLIGALIQVKDLPLTRSSMTWKFNYSGSGPWPLCGASS
ncbi:hypothetical protein [Bacillus sp. FSL K6-6540]|uniref:hypothetical protein n=1 Tax=Bacillus sp. FSL K6-6540 TaxID=2921512 RepID=UPI0030F8E008